MTTIEDTLAALAPADGWTPDWRDVRRRAGERRFVTRRRLLLAAVVALAVLVPLTAFGAANNWWFLRFGGPIKPAGSPDIVKTGVWAGRHWQLVAFPSTQGSLCFGIVTSPSGKTGALGCADVVGAGRPKHAAAFSITFLGSGVDNGFPANVVGPVIEQARTVEIRLVSGRTITTPTFAAPAQLGRARFYATQLPAGAGPAPRPGRLPRRPFTWVAGLDARGRVIACLRNGPAPPSACH